jgi:PAS domain S-box-containing protein
MHQTTTDLRDPEFEMFHFFEMTPDLVCIAGKEGFFKKINPAVINKLGYTKEELFSRPISSFIHPEDKDMTERDRFKLLNGQPLINFQNRYVAKNGKIVWLEWTSIYFPDREIVFAIAKDITKGKQNEKEIEEKYKKFKSLATHFKKSSEEEKKYLAIELHEELAQLASVVKMDIDWVSNNEPGLSAFTKTRMEHALAVAELLINTIRRISFSISPNMLDDLGLDATLEWHCREFSVLNGIPCSFESAYDETSLAREIKLDFFRICQEALSNVMYHAMANNVKIKIEDTGDKICLTIIDDGKGFAIEHGADASGLKSMQERVASINGQLTIQSETGKGTKVQVAITK